MFKDVFKHGGRDKDIFCKDLPTKSLRLGKILVSGASGYIGGRLVPELLARGYKIRVLVRSNPDVYQRLWPEVEVVVADVLNREHLEDAFEGVECAYYLIHSLHLGPKEFETVDIQLAANFRRAAEAKQVKRIIYLGGLGDVRSPLSSHLRNRIDVAEELKRGTVQTTILRAAVIIGSGSASYEIIQHLVRRLPIIFVSLRTNNKCQPIAVRDVIKYLIGVLEVPETAGRSFDIGGRDTLSYQQMLKSLASVFRKNIIFIPLPIPMIPFSAYWVSLVTPVPNAITQCLMDGLTNEVICLDESIKDLIPIKPLSYREAVVRAMSREEQDKVHTRWSDAYPPAHELALKLHECQEGGVAYTIRYSLLTERKASELFNSLCTIGGDEGWFHTNWMWRLRGALDRILLGPGTLRGRKKQSHLEITDVIDFWRVEDLIQDERLLLRAEMKIPGKAWLEFTIEEEEAKRKLSVIAYFDTHTIYGKIYWYLCFPFHRFIFKGLIEGIEKQS